MSRSPARYAPDRSADRSKQCLGMAPSKSFTVNAGGVNGTVTSSEDGAALIGCSLLLLLLAGTRWRNPSAISCGWLNVEGEFVKEWKGVEERCKQQ